MVGLIFLNSKLKVTFAWLAVESIGPLHVGRNATLTGNSGSVYDYMQLCARWFRAYRYQA
jgi:hypothetical protein